jgi:hypothetical protein
LQTYNQENSQSSLIPHCAGIVQFGEISRLRPTGT